MVSFRIYLYVLGLACVLVVWLVLTGFDCDSEKQHIPYCRQSTAVHPSAIALVSIFLHYFWCIQLHTHIYRQFPVISIEKPFFRILCCIAQQFARYLQICFLWCIWYGGMACSDCSSLFCVCLCVWWCVCLYLAWWLGVVTVLGVCSSVVVGFACWSILHCFLHFGLFFACSLLWLLVCLITCLIDCLIAWLLTGWCWFGLFLIFAII